LFGFGVYLAFDALIYRLSGTVKKVLVLDKEAGVVTIRHHLFSTRSFKLSELMIVEYVLHNEMWGVTAEHLHRRYWVEINLIMKNQVSWNLMILHPSHINSALLIDKDLIRVSKPLCKQLANGLGIECRKKIIKMKE